MRITTLDLRFCGTPGLIASYLVESAGELALIETGMSRQDAYVIVQRNAMEAWNGRKPFFDLLMADPDVTSRLTESELRGLFDYTFYLANIGATFERLGL